MLRGAEVLGGVFILGRIATTHMPAGKTQAQVNPGVASFHAVFANVLIRFSDLDLVQVRAFICHPSSPLKRFFLRSSDHRHVTKGHNHSQGPPLSPTIFLEASFCVAARLFILRINHRIHGARGAAVLGRLGPGWRE